MCGPLMLLDTSAANKLHTIICLSCVKKFLTIWSNQCTAYDRERGIDACHTHGQYQNTDVFRVLSELPIYIKNYLRPRWIAQAQSKYEVVQKINKNWKVNICLMAPIILVQLTYSNIHRRKCKFRLNGLTNWIFNEGRD